MHQFRRTATCGELRTSDTGRTVTLNGWVHRVRNHGGIHFINMRDRYGLTQIVIGEDSSEKLYRVAAGLKHEYVIAVEGIVRPRPAEMVNREMLTGEIEVAATHIEVLTTSATPPFMVDERSDAREDLRLRYRYLDLRSFDMQRKIKLRHDATFRVREYLNGQGFYEIDTPTLIRSTPEGARDFLVPSRLHSGKFYALPQSPQLYKQILMVSGFDRYFQIAHCFRDEDARGDRQLEFTQIDLEMSFVSKEDVFAVIEGMLGHVFGHTLSIELEPEFPRISYDEAMNRFGSDKPDLRFGLELSDVTELVSASAFEIFRGVAESGGAVKAVVAPGCADYSRRQITNLEETAKVFGAKGLAWMKITESGVEGGIAKFLAEEAGAITMQLGASVGDLVLFVADKWSTACAALGAVRIRLGEELDLIDNGIFRFVWIVDFPLFDWNNENQQWEASHHMFAMPQHQFLDTLEQDPESVKGELYDLVCNGVELASGSIRIHDPVLQRRIFKVVGLPEEEAERQFGFLLEAFKYGVPPHGGIAPGLDRLVMLMAGEQSIREVIAFPKNTLGVCPMDDSPSEVAEDQLAELAIQLAPRTNKPTVGDPGEGSGDR